MRHATVNIGEFKNIPLIGIPVDATEMECECCGKIVHITQVKLNEEGNQFQCERCRSVYGEK